MQLINIAIKRPIFISMVTLFLTAIGILSIRFLPIDLYPDVSYPTLSVRVDLPGAAPEEVEQLITKRLEDTLSTISGVKLLRSISREAQAIISLEFENGIDIRFQEIQVRAKISNIKSSLPKSANDPIVYRQDPDDIPIVEIAVTGSRPTSVLTKFSEDEIARRIRQISGVGSVELNGGRNREIKIDLNENSLQSQKIDANEVINAIRNFNRNDPIGRIEGKNRTWILRSLSQISSPADLENIPITKDKNGHPVLLKELATIYDGFEEIRAVTLLGDHTGLRPSIIIDVYKQSGENSLEISNRIKKSIEGISSNLPEDISLKVTRDNADLIRTNVLDVAESLLIGAILTVIVVLFFLRSPRSTITTGIALPNSVITTFAAMAIFGFSINIMTLLALSLAIGLLVDDAIVVRENIFRHLQNKSISPAQAAEIGTREVIIAVMATTLTIVAVFVPVAFMDGVTGQFFKQFALTVVFAIIVSTWDAVTMAPMLSAHFANFSDPDDEWRRLGKIGQSVGNYLRKFEHSFDKLNIYYTNCLKWTIQRGWISLTVALISALIAIIGFILVPKSFLPSQLGTTFQANLNGPLALSLDEIKRVGESSNNNLSNIPELEYWTMKVGFGFNGSANIRFNIKVKPEFSRNQNDLAQVRKKVRQSLSSYPGYLARISEPSDPLSGSGSGRFAPISVQIAGENIAKIREIARNIRQKMVTIDGITDVPPIDDLGIPEIRIYPDSILAAQFGITPQDINNSLNIWVEGNIENSLRLGDEQIPIRVRLANANIQSPEKIFSSIFFTKTGTGDKAGIPIENLIKWEPKAGPPTIIRESRQRIMRLNANLQPGAALGDVAKSLQMILNSMPLPSGYSLKIIGQNEQMYELGRNVIFAVLIGSIFVYMVIASLFESLLHPLTVMAAIPLAATGAVLALLITGKQLDLYGGIGMILLAGIVAKNSILLVDFAIQRINKDGIDPSAAILEAAPVRLRPILMTSIAMIAGMLPIATGLGSGGAARQSLGVATIGGVISSTILTLWVVPNLFVWLAKYSQSRRSS